MTDILSLITAEYNEKKQRAENAAKINYEKAMQDREFSNAEKQIRQLIIKSAKASLKISGKNSFDKEIEKLETVKEQALKKLKIRFTAPQYSCKNCGDTGFAGNSPCKCFKQRINELISEECGLYLPKLNKFEDFDLKLFDEKEKDRAFKIKETFINYCDNFPQNKKLNLIFSGKTGSGKSFMASCVCSKLIERGFSIIFATAFSLNNLFLKYHVSFTEQKNVYLNAVNSADLLVIDDLGCENLYNNVTNEYFLAVLNERSLHNKATIITTNLDPQGIKSNYQDRFVSRLLDQKTNHFIIFNYKDLRLNKIN